MSLFKVHSQCDGRTGFFYPKNKTKQRDKNDLK